MINYYDKQTDSAATEVSSELQCTDAFFVQNQRSS
jgi:hypothetical protein